MIILISLLLTVNRLWCCVDGGKSEAENISCVLSIEKKSEITNKLISECLKLTSQDRFAGYLCLCRINKLNAKIDLAVISCSKAKEKNPFSPYPHIEFADIYLSKNKKDIAKTEIEFALNIDSQNFHTNLKAGEIFESINQNKALEYYIRASDLLKTSNEIYIIGKKNFIENKIKKLKEELKKRKIEEKENRYLQCISSYKKEKDTSLALEKIEMCMKMKEQHSQSIYVDYIKLLYENGKYSEVVKNTSLLKNPDTEIIKIIADSFYKTEDYSNAVKYYKKIIKDDTYDFELLSKYATALEKTKDILSAIEIYTKMNNLKPSKKFEDKIDELKIASMSDKDILNELKIRGFVEKEKVVLLPPEKKLFLTIKLAERNGAIKYLSEKYSGYANIILTNPQNPTEIKITSQGYNLYMKYVSQKFIKEIGKTASDPRDIFIVKDKDSNPIFEKNGILSYEGLRCYYEYEKTKTKNWFFPNEIPPTQSASSYLDTQKNSIFQSTKKKLEKLGYEEITESEYLWLLKATNCPEDVLENPPCNIKKIDSGNGMKYFMCMKEGLCNDIQIKLALYIASYRNGNTDIPQGKATPFFGSNPTPKKHFCEDGKIWQGD